MATDNSGLATQKHLFLHRFFQQTPPTSNATNYSSPPSLPAKEELPGLFRPGPWLLPSPSTSRPLTLDSAEAPCLSWQTRISRGLATTLEPQVINTRRGYHGQPQLTETTHRKDETSARTPAPTPSSRPLLHFRTREPTFSQ